MPGWDRVKVCLRVIACVTMVNACVTIVKSWLRPIFTINSHGVGQLEDHG